MYRTLLTVILIATTHAGHATQNPDGPYQLDFGKDGCSLCDWVVVVDGVMGGLSEGQTSETNETLVFEGSVSLENNGGFASVRSLLNNYDLNHYQAASIRYKSTGQNFDFVLYNYRAFFRPVYKLRVPATKGEWQTITLPLRDFGRYRLGQPMDGRPSDQDLETVIRFGLSTADKKASKFRMEIDYIQFE